MNLVLYHSATMWREPRRANGRRRDALGATGTVTLRTWIDEGTVPGGGGHRVRDD
ncbi:hypothetical protein [Iamia sp.]|uniref:hypothetical protein n=1 Tax=Iamia sp. TaxID=2722710 RepID=UPI002C9E8C55|nr:hypothetical protein [Iamia sp.]HXH59655.1 hypothetical protein [Iamia sp.]